MGAALGCYRGPDPDVEVVAARYLHGVHGAKRSSSYAMLAPSSAEKTVLGKLQRTLSLSLLRSRTETSGVGGGGGAAKDITGSLFSHDEVGGDLASWDLTRSYSSASGTSGSRMLSDFYNLVLESERNTFFKDKHGKRVKGAYLDEIRIIDDYFGPDSRKRQRAITHKQAMESKLPIMERFAYLPTALMSTTSTISSEMDYWSCLDSMSVDQEELELSAKRAPRRHDSSLATMNGQLLFSPMHADGGNASAAARRLSKSLSPHNGWPGYDVQFNEDDDDDGEDEDVGSQSAYGYTWDQLRQNHQQYQHYDHQKQLDSAPSSLATTSSSISSGRPPIYFTPDAARNASAVAPMMAS